MTSVKIGDSAGHIFRLTTTSHELFTRRQSLPSAGTWSYGRSFKMSNETGHRGAESFSGRGLDDLRAWLVRAAASKIRLIVCFALQLTHQPSSPDAQSSKSVDCNEYGRGAAKSLQDLLEEVSTALFRNSVGVLSP